jgi:hypothetical protein
VADIPAQCTPALRMYLWRKYYTEKGLDITISQLNNSYRWAMNIVV